MVTHTRSQLQLAPAAAGFPIAFAIDSDFFASSARDILRAAYDPDGDGIGQAFFAKRLSDVGPRRRLRTADYYRAVAGFNWDAGADWEIEGHYSFARAHATELLENDVFRSCLQQAILVDPATGNCADPSNGCVPANVFGEGNLSEEAIAFVGTGELSNSSRSTQHVASLAATGPLFNLPAGDLLISAGAEYRRNSASFDPEPTLATGDTLGFFSTGEAIDGGFEVFELFAEAVVPLLEDHPIARRLELEAGARYSDYSSSGGVWTWKAGGQWLPTQGLRLRGVWQRAVRAPNIEELLEGPSSNQTAFPGTFDFCLARNDPVGNGLRDVCIAQGMAPDQVGVYDAPPGLDLSDFVIPVSIVCGGNLDLRPESADTITFGADYGRSGPVNIAIGASYFEIDLQGAIADGIDPFGICAVIKDAASPVCSLVTRAANGLPLEVSQKPINVASARVSGVDLRFDLSTDAPGWLAPRWAGDEARLSLRSLATHYTEYGAQATPTAPFIDCVGGFARDCAFSTGATFPDILVNTTFAYDASRFGTALRWRIVGPMDNQQPQFDALAGIERPPLAIPSVGARHYLDFSLRFDLTEMIRVTAVIDNLLETAPPLLGRQAEQSNTAPGRYDIFGRRFFLGLQARFGI